MAKYNHANVAGESWIRCFRVEINNPLPNPNASVQPVPVGLFPEGVPNIFFIEEKVCQLADGAVVKQPVNNNSAYAFAKEQFSAETFSTVFPLVDSDGNETKETATFADVYTLLASLYLYAAKHRDASLVELEAAQAERLKKMQELQAVKPAVSPV